MTLNLTTTNRQEEIIKQYLENNVSETLAEKINNGIKTEKDGKTLLSKKNLSGFFKYATEEARKQAEKGANSAMIEEKVVYGWVMHYFEEDSILGTLYNEDGTEYKPIVKKTSKPTVTPTTTYTPPVKKPEPQMSFFDMLSPKKEEPKQEEIQTPIEDNDEPTTEDIQDAFEELEREEIKEEKSTNPIYTKYFELQKQYPYSIIAYRLGDFYEVFGDGAIKVSNELELTLTGRDFGLKERVSMVGFPFHARENYFEKIAKFSELVIYDNNNITIYTCDKKPYTFDMETGEIANSESSNAIINDLLKIFGNDMEILL